jgi:protein-S-isoprenylcysteine O-methyltransferase Ste14
MKWLELRIPPLALTAAVAVGMVGTAHGLPWLRFALPAAAAAVIAIVVAIIGASLAILGVYEFRRAHTTVNPVRPGNASRVVTSGVYRLSRNPMYLGIWLLLLALAAYQSHALSFAWVAVFAAYMNRFQIGPEERVLESMFGDEYRAYSRAVRRWI